MIDSFIAGCMRNRFIVLIVAAVVAIIGIRIAYITPVDAIPDLSENQVIVFADWMGRSPKEIEDQVTYPLSVALQGLAGVKAVRSSSEFNFSMINVIFEDHIDFYFSRQRVLEKLSTANTFLPQGVVPYMAPDATALGQIFWYTIDGKGVDLDRLRAIQDWYVRYQLNSVPGVAQVATVGGAAREYQIDIDPQKLRAYGITLGEVSSAVARSNSSVGGRVIHKGNAEYLIRSVGWIRSIRDIENIMIAGKNQIPIYVKNIAKVQMGPEFKRAVLEKDGGESVGGVVMMRFGENPLEVTRRVKEKIRALQSGLPEGVSIVPFYDRTALIQRAIHTLTGTLTEELIVTSLVVFLVMGHLGASVAVCLSLPLAVLVSMILMHYFNISSNIMSLSGIAISIGVIVDQSIVMVDNAAHNLYLKFEGKPVTGDNTEFLIPHCQSVGRPIFFSVLIMIVSFFPVFALGGMEGKMFHPLAFTKVFAFIGVSIISISFVPAILPWFIRGRLYKEEDNWLVRQFIEIYRPVLKLLMNRPKLVVWSFVLILAFGFLFMGRLGREFMPVLDEGSSLEMPITVPRASVTETADDIRVRDALIMQVPEVEQVVGKSGRADTPTDPSPLDMIETIINFHPMEHWPKRQLFQKDGQLQARNAVSRLSSIGFFNSSATSEVRNSLADEVGMEELSKFDAAIRSFCLQRKEEYKTVLGEKLLYLFQSLVRDHAKDLGKFNFANPAGPASFPQSISEKFLPIMARGISIEEVDTLVELVRRHEISANALASDTDLRQEAPFILSPLVDIVNTIISKQKKDIPEQFHERILKERFDLLQKRTLLVDEELFHFAAATWAHLCLDALVKKATEKGFVQAPLSSDVRKGLVEKVAENFKSGVFLWKKDKPLLVQEMDLMLSMPGWGNIWTQPIINRIDMLSTGVRTMIGVKVFGKDIQEIQVVSEKIADILKAIPGAVDVFPDQNVGKGYLEIQINRENAARYGVAVGDIQDTIEIALGGKAITTTVEGRERFPVRLRYSRDFREDEQQIRKLLVSGASAGGMGSQGGGQSQPGSGGMGGGMGGGVAKRPAVSGNPDPSGGPLQIPLAAVADVQVVEGPAMIKSENGLLRSYVQLNVRDRDIVGFVEEAQRTIAAKMTLPQGMFIEWSGQFEHQIRARKTLSIVFPLVVLIIFVILYITYHDLADALLMMLAVPGAVAGGIIFQYFLGINFSVAVWVGYIACFGMATETGIIMLVYLRLAIEEKGGLEKIASLDELKDTIIKGAVHRLRPKLLTEGTTIIGLAPMLWATGTGAEIIRPMAAPVLGGILFADEVIDLFLPVLFYQVRKRRWLAIQAANDKEK